MAQKSWECVLLEWVNCLDLCEAIDTLEELREGTFYRNLLKIVKSPGGERSVVHFIFNLLKTQYPNFLFDTDNVISWTDLSHKDLVSVTSLLLHHTCITVRQDVITLPLCSKLPQNTQLIIKAFLENIDLHITREKLEEVIERCMKIKQIVIIESPLSEEYEDCVCATSPLQSLLSGTPKTNKSRLFEKEREIKQLKNDLELERYEKADLQEELRLQKDENKSIKKELTIKLQENKHLRNEILALQNKTPPHFNHGDSMQMQRRLKADIEHLEAYIKKLEKEQYDLEEQLQHKTELLKKIEKECSTWKNKAIALETTNETLCEKLEEQQLELNNLQQHSMELSAMLEEFKTQTKSADTSATWVTNQKSFGILNNSEDLAQTVVDVQLRDVQKENEDLRNSINECLAKIEKLSLELSTVNSKYEDCEKTISELQTNNMHLSKDLINSKESLKTCQSELENVSEVNQKLRDDNIMLQDRIKHFENEQILLSNELKESKTSNSQLKKEFEVIQSSLKDKESSFRLIKEENKSLYDELSQTKNELKEVELKLNLAIKDYKTLDGLIEKYYRKLEFILFQENDKNVSFEDKEHLFSVFLENIENETKTKADEREKLTEKVISLQELIKELNQKENIILTEKLQVEKDLVVCQQVLKSCQEKLEGASEVNQKIEKYNNDLQADILKLENEKHLLIQENCSLHDELSGMKNELKETYVKLDCAVEDNKNLDILIGNYYRELELVLFEEVDESVSFEDKEHLFVMLLQNIEKQIKVKTEEKRQLYEKTVSLQEQVEKLNQKEINILTEKLQIENDLSACQKVLKSCQEELQSSYEVNEKIEKFNSDIQADILKLKGEKDLLFGELEDYKTINIKLKNELEVLKTNYEDTESSLKKKESSLQLLLQENSDLHNELSEMKNQLKVICMQLDLAVEDNRKLDMLIEKYYKNVELILFEEVDEGVSFEDKEQLFNLLLQNISNQLKTKDKEREELIVKIDSLQEEIEKLNQKERNTLTEKLQVEGDLSACQKNLKTCQEELQNAFEVNWKIETHNSNLQADILKLQSEKHLLFNEFEDLKTNYEVIESNLKEKESNLQLLLEEKGSLHSELSEIKNQLHDTCIKLDLAEENNKKLNMLIEKYYKSIGLILSKEIDKGVSFEDKEQLFVELLQNIENQIKIKDKENEKLIEQIASLQEEIETLNQKEINLLTEKLQIEEDLSTYQKNLKSCEEKLQSLCDVNQKIETYNSNLQEDILKLQSEKFLLSNELENYKTVNNRLKSELEALKTNCKTIELSLKEKEGNLQMLLQEKDTLHSELSEIQNQWKTTCTKLDLAEENNKKLNLLIEQYYKGVELILSEEIDEGVSFEDKEQLFVVLSQNIENEIKSKNKEIEKLTNEMAGLQQEIKNFNQKQKNVLAEKLQLENDMSSCQKELEISQESNKRIGEQNINLQEKVTKLDNEKHLLLKELEECKLIICQLQNQLDSLSVEINSKLKEIDSQDCEIKKLQVENLEHVKETEALSCDKRKLLDKCEVLESKVTDLEKVVTQLQASEIHFGGIIKEKQKEIQDLKILAEINDKNSEEALNETIKRFTDEIGELKEKVLELTIATDNFKLQEICHLDKIQELKSNLSNITDKYTESLQLYQEFKAESEGQIACLTENLHDLVTKYNECENNYSVCCSKLKEAEKLNEILETDKYKLEKQFKNEYVKLIDFTQNLKGLIENGDGKTTDVINFDTENIGIVMEKTIEKLTKAFLQISNSLDTLKEENNYTKKLYLEIQNEYKGLLSQKEFELKNAEMAIENSEQQIHHLTQRQKQVECDVEKWKKQCVENEILIANLENKIISMKDIQELIEVEKDTLQKECSSLKEELNFTKMKLNEKEKQHEVVVNQLNSKIDSLENEIVRVKEIHQQLKDEQINLEMTWKKEKQLFLEDTKNMLELKAEKETLEEALKTSNANNKTFKDLVKEYKDILAEKIEMINELQEIVQNHQQKCDKLNEIVEQKSTEINITQKEKELLNYKLEEIQTETELLKKQKDELLTDQKRIAQEVEEKLSNAQQAQEKLRNCLSTKVVELLKKLNEFEVQLHHEKQSKEMLEMNISALQLEKNKFENVFVVLSENIRKLENALCEDLNDDGYREELPNALTIIVERVLKLSEYKNVLQNNNAELEKALLEKQEVVSDLQFKLDVLQTKYEQLVKQSGSNEQQSKKVAELEETVNKFKNNFVLLCKHIKIHQEKLKKVYSELYSAEQLLDNARSTLNQLPAISEANHKLLFERKESLDFIVQDIIKQFRKFSKTNSTVMCTLLNALEKTINGILIDGDTTFEFFENFNIHDETEFLQDLKSRIEDTLQQINTLQKDINYKLEMKQANILKENTNPQSQKLKEDDLRRKTTILKQRVTLAENAKSNLERKIKQLREENKKLIDGVSVGFVSKTEHERILNANTTKYQNLLQQYEELASKCADLSQERGGQTESHYKKLQNEYCNLMSEKSQLELQYESAKKTLEDYAAQVADLSLIKEAYDKLVEESNQLMMECDTLNYKRTRDREEYERALQKLKTEFESKENKKIREIRSEYEAKLEKMKENMIKLYKEEVDKEMQKLSWEKSENVYLMRNIEQLRSHLQEANFKIHQLEIERDRALDKIKLSQMQLSQRENDLFSSRESLRSVTSREGSVVNGSLPRGERPIACRSSVSSRISSNSVAPMNSIESARCGKENTAMKASVQSLPSEIGQNLKMEDEDDDFNNKYLSDLKEGKCVLPAEKTTNPADRLSELVWRNSLCPPHLKSSYPAELQFISPRCIKEDDIKSGNIDMDDSMSTKLLPSEKPRIKKDIGTTSYKKPGPPTPSKNGGKLSLQGNEGREPSQESTGEVKTPKRMTPKRIKALFMGRNINSKDNSENRSVTPRSKRLSNIFRKPR